MFLLEIDWLMRKVTEEKREIHWIFTSALEDIDFADDISLLSHTQTRMQEKSEKLNTEGKKLGPKINQNKSKIMRINNKNRNRIKIKK